MAKSPDTQLKESEGKNGQPEKQSKNDIQKCAEVWAAELRTPSWQLAALKQHLKITEGKSLTEKEYKDGIVNAVNRPL